MRVGLARIRTGTPGSRAGLAWATTLCLSAFSFAGALRDSTPRTSQADEGLLAAIAGLQAQVETSKRSGDYSGLGEPYKEARSLESWSRHSGKLRVYVKAETGENNGIGCLPIHLKKVDTTVWTGELPCPTVSPAESLQYQYRIPVSVGNEFVVHEETVTEIEHGVVTSHGGSGGFETHGSLTGEKADALVYGGYPYFYQARCFFEAPAPDTLWKVDLEKVYTGARTLGIGYHGRKYSKAGPCTVNGSIKARLDRLNGLLSELGFVDPRDSTEAEAAKKVYRSRTACKSDSGEASLSCPSRE